MAPPPKRFLKCVTKPQILIIVETMETNKQLHKGLINSNYTAEQKMADWESLTEKLNAAGGAVKELKIWQKCWTDYKSEVKKKYNMKVERSKTGGGSTVDLRELTALEERILALIGLDAVDGLPVPESCYFPDSQSVSQDVPCASQESQDAYIVPQVIDFEENSELDVSTIQVEVNAGTVIDIPNVTPTAGRLNSIRQNSSTKRTRNRGIVLGTENSAKLIQAQESTASGLMAVAAALEKTAEQQQKLIDIQRENLALEERKT